MIFRALVTFLLIAIFSPCHFAQTYNMTNGTNTTCSGNFFDSGGPGDNIGVWPFCILQNSYENNEDFTETFCSGSSQSIRINFDFLEIVGSDYLEVHDGINAGAPLIGTITSAWSTGSFISSGTCLTFVFHSDDNGTGLSGCDDGGNWSSSISCVTVYTIDDPTTVSTCDGMFADEGGLGNDYSANQSYTKTFCNTDANGCIKINLSELDLGTGDVLEFFSGNVAIGIPIISLTNGDAIPGMGITSNQGECLTVKFTSNGDASVGTGWKSSVFCPPACAPVACDPSSPMADNQCITATQICTFSGYCGNTSNTYNSIDHLGTDWNNNNQLMDDFCGSIENNSWLSFDASETTAVLDVYVMNCANASGIQMQIYDSPDCGDFIPVSNCTSPGAQVDFTINATSLTVGNTYYLMIDGFAGDVCDYVISPVSGVEVGYEILTTDADNIICSGEPLDIYVTNTDSSSFAWYSIPADASITSIDDSVISVAPVVTTTYYCAVTDTSITVSQCGSVTQTFQTTITVSPSVSIDNATVVNELCSESNGSVAIDAVSGGTTFTYNWSPNILETSNTAGNLPAGTFTVIVTNESGCTADTSFTLTNNDSVISAIFLSSTDETCTGLDGDATVDSIQGGSTVITSYSWDPAGITQTITGIAAGNYIVTVTDDDGCTFFGNVVVGFTGNVTAGFTYTGDSCLATNSIDFTSSNSGNGETFSWDFGDGPPLSTLTDPSHSYLVAGSFIVSQTATLGTKCTDTYTTSVNILSGPSMSFSQGLETCFMDCDGWIAATPSGTMPYSWNWSDGSTNDTLLNVCAGNYSVIITDGNGCTISGNTNIASRPKLIFSAVSTDSALCSNSTDGQATVSVSGGTGSNYAYLWGANTNNQTQSTALSLPKGDYSPTVTDGNGCTIDTTLTIYAPDTITLVTNPVSSLCFGDSVTLSVQGSGGTGNLSYTWSYFNWQPKFGQSISDKPVLFGTTPNEYTVYATDANLCKSANVIIQVFVRTPLSFDLEVDDDVICPNSSTFIEFKNAQGGYGGPYAYYHYGDGTPTLFTPPLTVNVSESDTIITIAITELGCSSSTIETALIEIIEFPIVDFTVDISEGCQPLECVFSYDPLTIDEIWGKGRWNFGDDGYSNEAYNTPASHEYEKFGFYDVSLTFLHRIDSCLISEYKQDYIHVKQRPNANFTASPVVTSFLRPEVEFKNNTDIYTSFEWNFGDNTIETQNPDPPHTFPANSDDPAREYLVRLFADYNGCSDMDSMIITIEDEYTFYAPSAIVLDGSTDPRNAEFKIRGHGIDYKHFHLIIYDRWGEVVFESFNQDHAWNGKVKGKNLAEMGVYKWLCTYRFLDNQEYQRSGTVTVLR